MSQSNEWSVRVLVGITKGDDFQSYLFKPVKEEDLNATQDTEEGRAWLLIKQGEGTVYRLACHTNGNTTCDCPGYKDHKNCKHSDWLKAWGIAFSTEEATEFAQMECELGHQYATVERLTEDRDRLLAENKHLRHRLDVAETKLRELEEPQIIRLPHVETNGHHEEPAVVGRLKAKRRSKTRSVKAAGSPRRAA